MGKITIKDYLNLVNVRLYLEKRQEELEKDDDNYCNGTVEEVEEHIENLDNVLKKLEKE